MTGFSKRSPLTEDEAKQFFASLYKDDSGSTVESKVMDRGDFHKIATRFVASKNEETVVGEDALQSLVLNFLLSNGTSVNPGEISVPLAHISRAIVAEMVRNNPKIDVDTLISKARAAGIEVEIIEG